MSSNTETNKTVDVAVTVSVADKTKACEKSESTRPLTPPDSPRTKSIKYNLYATGGFYQGKKYFKDDYQGQAEYLQDQIFKKEVSMTPEERQAHLEEIEYLDDDYMWSSFD